MGYTKTFTATIVRTKHKIDFRAGTSKTDLLRMLDDVPPDAIVDEVLSEDDGTASIEFHEEKLKK